MKTLIGFILFSGIVSLSFGKNDFKETIETTQETKIDTFTFSSNGTEINGRIYLPDSFSKEQSLPAIYLIDFVEQHFRVAKDEFEKVISATQELQDFDAVVVTLEEHLNVDANTGVFQKYYDIYKDMTSYVDENYTNNTSRTFIGRGSEAGLVLMTLFNEDSVASLFKNYVATDSPSSFNSYIVNKINTGDFPENTLNKNLHFSFSTSNNRSSCMSMINKINQSQYPWLQFESFEYTTSNYENTYPVAFADGLKFVFSDLSTGSKENFSAIPMEYHSEQNYPNPFNPSTTIAYSIPEEGRVQFKIFNTLGEEVATLTDEFKAAGVYNKTFDASGLPSGVYIYSIRINNYSASKKMLLIK